jgi:Fe-S-cluster containining protein
MVTDLEEIAAFSHLKEIENEQFVEYLKSCNSNQVDEAVIKINAVIEPQIDCTKCGNCCKTLMVNVTAKESEELANFLHLSLEDTKAKYLEEGLQQTFIMKSFPCAFLEGTKCSIYENRFEGCKEFPNLNKTEFTKRLFTTMMHYDRCPIIFNVMEDLKSVTGFI